MLALTTVMDFLSQAQHSAVAQPVPRGLDLGTGGVTHDQQRLAATTAG
jgi:hypothetical protein